MYEQPRGAANRQRRVKTDYAQPSEVLDYLPHDQSSIIDKYPSELNESNSDAPFEMMDDGGHHSISSIFAYLQAPVDYENISDREIQEERNYLEDHVRFLNNELTHFLDKRKSKIQAGISRRVGQLKRSTSHVKYNEWDEYGILRQVDNNKKFISLLRDQYLFLANKLSRRQEQSLKNKCQEQINETQAALHKLKFNLLDRKKKAVLADKKLVQLEQHDSSKAYSDCQQEYIALSRKKQQLALKINKTTADSSRLIDQHIELDRHFTELKSEFSEVYGSISNQAEGEHAKLMYDAKCRKMELCLRKRERDEECYKRKYYELLKTYERTLQNLRNLDDKLHRMYNVVGETSQLVGKQRRKIALLKLEQKNQPQKPIRIWRLQSQSSKVDEEQKQEGDQQGDQQGFLLTQLSTKRISVKLPHNSKPGRHKTEHTEQRYKSHSDFTQSDALQKVHKIEPNISQAQLRDTKGLPDIRGRPSHAYRSVNLGSNTLAGQKAEGQNNVQTAGQEEEQIEQELQSGVLEQSRIDTKIDEGSYLDDFQMPSPLLREGK